MSDNKATIAMQQMPNEIQWATAHQNYLGRETCFLSSGITGPFLPFSSRWANCFRNWSTALLRVAPHKNKKDWDKVESPNWILSRGQKR